jgi:tRNA-dihydrouridine synthase B
MRIGPYVLANPLAVAPMAGVTDRPFRQLCKRLGAGYAVSEMVAANPRLWATDKSRRRTDHAGEGAPIAVQIAGGDPQMIAAAARYNVERGAQIIDINLGCPAKKVCNAAAGSALLSDEPLVAAIVRAAVAAAGVPVTLKLRTGPHPGARNAVRLARMAESEGIAALALHGRTRACAFVGAVEYDTIASVKDAVRIPVFANGDIRTPLQARDVLVATGADGLMIGRAAQGRPWIFREILHFLATGESLPAPTVAEARSLIAAHLGDHYDFYGEELGVRIARKHLGWYTAGLPGGDGLRSVVNETTTAPAQTAAVDAFFATLAARGERLVYGTPDAPSPPRGARPHAPRVERPAARPWAGEALAA